MFFAAWWHPSLPRDDSIESRVRALLDSPHSTRAEGLTATIAVWSPARLERLGRKDVAYAAEGPDGVMLQAQPSVELEAETLTATVGPLLSYPLYYCRGADDEYVFLCSRLEPLARLRPQAALRTDRLLYVMRSSQGAADPDPGATVYSGIRCLRPCETLTAGSAGVRLNRHVPRLSAGYLAGKPKDLAIELRRQIERAVDRAMGSAGRVAVFVSGGMDSSGVLAVAAARSRSAGARELIPLSVQFASPGDDRPYLEELATDLAVTPVRLTARDAGKWVERSLYADGQPATVSTACMFLALSEAAVNRHVDISLCASMGDNLLGGPLPFAQLALRGHPVAAVTAAVRLRAPWETTACTRVRSLILSPLVPPNVFRRRRRRARAPWLSRYSLSRLDRAYDAAERSARSLPDSPDEWMRALCDDPDQCDSADGAGQMFSLTGCAPFDVFMDLDFVRFVLQIDPVLLSYGNEYRGLYRAAMKGILPERIRRRQDKSGFESGVAGAIASSDAFELFRDLLSLRALASSGLVEAAPLKPILDLCLAGVRRGERTTRDPSDEYWAQVWQLVSVEAFLREHGKGRDLA